jgi:hypothetical protein
VVSIDLPKPVEFSPHALEKIQDRGTTQAEVLAAIRGSGGEPARKGRLMFRKNFVFNRPWRGKQYAIKQVVPVVTEETSRLVVVTVFVYYF